MNHPPSQRFGGWNYALCPIYPRNRVPKFRNHSSSKFPCLSSHFINFSPNLNAANCKTPPKCKNNELIHHFSQIICYNCTQSSSVAVSTLLNGKYKPSKVPKLKLRYIVVRQQVTTTPDKVYYWHNSTQKGQLPIIHSPTTPNVHYPLSTNTQ